MKKIYRLALSLLFFFVLSISIVNAQGGAQQTTDNSMLGRLKRVADLSYNTSPEAASTPKIVGTIVGAFIGFTGLTFIVLMIIAGYGWMTAGGSEEKIKKSVETIKAAIIGLVVSLSAWILWKFIFDRLIA
jgi:hypothetical protein